MQTRENIWVEKCYTGLSKLCIEEKLKKTENWVSMAIVMLPQVFLIAAACSMLRRCHPLKEKSQTEMGNCF